MSINFSDAELDKLIKERYATMPGKSKPTGRPSKPKVVNTKWRKIRLSRVQIT
jgi:hypothetical protein